MSVNLEESPNIDSHSVYKLEMLRRTWYVHERAAGYLEFERSEYNGLSKLRCIARRDQGKGPTRTYRSITIEGVWNS